jgi:hypothetical protein
MELEYGCPLESRIWAAAVNVVFLCQWQWIGMYPAVNQWLVYNQRRRKITQEIFYKFYLPQILYFVSLSASVVDPNSFFYGFGFTIFCSVSDSNPYRYLLIFWPECFKMVPLIAFIPVCVLESVRQRKKSFPTEKLKLFSFKCLICDF